MSDSVFAGFKRAVEKAIGPLARFAWHPATVQTQGIDGRIDASIDEGGPLPGVSEASPVYGLPGTTCKVPQGTRARIAFDNGDTRKRIFGCYDSGASVTEINFANATINQLAARKGDTVFAGTFTWTPTPPAGAVPTGGVLTYQLPLAPGDQVIKLVAWSIVGPVAITQVYPPSETASIELRGVIDSGSSVVKIGG